MSWALTSDLLAGSPYAPLENVTHAKFFGDLADFYRLAAVNECRVSRDHEEAGNLGKVGDQVVGHPVSKGLLPRLAGHIGERQHSDGWLVR